MSIICKLRGHIRDAHRAWHDGIDWRSSCVRCDAPLIKDESINGWRAFDRENDFRTSRRGKPEKSSDRYGTTGA
jgi:hypothetical protein